MNEFMIYIALAVFGAVFGSFAAASVWRTRAYQLDADKKAKEPYNHEEYTRLKKLLGKSITNDRSQCLHCGYKLRWYDLVPIVSWLQLRGRCRNCHKPIGIFELLMELGMTAIFVASYALWPSTIETGLDITYFIVWLMSCVVMGVLFAYDSKWFLLPNRHVIILTILGLIAVGTEVAQSQSMATQTVLSAIGAVAVLSGLYGFIWLVSKGRWVGLGDVKLGVGLALLLVHWELAIVALLLANLIGCLVVIPLLFAKKLKRTSHIPFGPFLILGTVVAFFFGWPIIGAYLSFVVG